MRCAYCRPAAGNGHNRNPSTLTVGEIEALVLHLVSRHGLRKVRLTGGEPTSRPDLIEIIDRLARIDGLAEVVMTTNGLKLARLASALADAGLHRVNVSLDSLDPPTFRQITGVDGLPHVLAGIDAATNAGLTPVKLNTVVLRGRNHDELPAMVRFATDRGLEIRFIELMPMGPFADNWSQGYVSATEMRKIVDPVVDRWQPLPQGTASAKRFRVRLTNGQTATVGFVTAMSCNFCVSCDRVRIAADGAYYPCLMNQATGNLATALRPLPIPAKIDHILQDGLLGKALHHPRTGSAVMTLIGG